MLSWFSNIFGGNEDHDDTHEQVIYRDKYITQGITDVLDSYIPNNPNTVNIKVISQLINRINQIYSNKTKEMKLKIDKETQILVDFINPLFEYLQLIFNKQTELQATLACIYILSTIFEVPPKIFNVSNAICILVILYSTKPTLSDIINNILILHLRSRDFIRNLATVDFFGFVIVTLFTKSDYTSGLGWFIQQFSIHTRNISFQSEELQAITLAYISSINQQEILQSNFGYSIAFYVAFSKLFKDPDPIKYFLENQGLVLVQKYSDPSELPKNLAELACMSNFENNQILKIMKAGYLENNDRMVYAQAFRTLFSNEDFPIAELDSICPIIEIFTIEVTTADLSAVLIDSIVWISYRKYEKAIFYAACVLRFIDKDFVTFESQTLFFNLLTSQFDNNNLSILQPDFTIFLSQAKEFEKLSKLPSFNKVIPLVYSTINDRIAQSRYIRILFEQNAKNELIGVTFAQNSNFAVMQDIIQKIQQKYVNKLGMLTYSFAINQECAKIFWKFGGLTWLDVFPDITIDQYKEFLESSINDHTELYVTKWISSIALSHRFFTLDKNFLTKICYSEHRIRVPSLLPFADIRNNVMIGMAYFATDEGIPAFIRCNNFDSPVLDKMLALKLPFTYFSSILENHKHLDQLVDRFYSYPMLEFGLGGNSHFNIKTSCRGFSFWMRVADTKFLTEIFSSDFIRGIFVSNSFVFTFVAEDYNFVVDENDWFFVAVQLDPENKNLILQINNNTETIHYKKDYVNFPDVTFGAPKQTNLWYIADNILIHKSSFDINLLYEEGIPFNSNANTNTDPNQLISISPYDGEFDFNGVIPIKSTGFAWHLSFPHNLYTFYNMMMKSESAPEMHLRTLLKMIKINQNISFDMFIQPLKKYSIDDNLMELIIQNSINSFKFNFFLNDLELMKKYDILFFRELSKMITEQIKIDPVALSLRLYSNNYIIEDCCEIARRSKSVEIYKVISSFFRICDESSKVRILSILEITEELSKVFTPDFIASEMLQGPDYLKDRFNNLLIELSAKFPNYYQYTEILAFAFMKTYTSNTFNVMECLISGSYFRKDHKLTKIARPEYAITAVSLVFQALTILISAPPKTLEKLENETFNFIKNFVKIPKSEFDCLSDLRIRDIIAFFGPFVFNPKSILKHSVIPNIDDNSVLQDLAESWGININQLTITDKIPISLSVSYPEFILKFLEEHDINAVSFHDREDEDSLSIFSKSSCLTEFYSQLLISFILDAESFRISLLSLLGQYCSRHEILIGDLALNVIVIIFTRPEIFAAPLQIFIDLFRFLCIAVYQGYFTDMAFLFSSLLPVLSALYQSPQLTELSTNEEVKLYLRSILMHIFDVSLDDVPQLFAIVNSISVFFFQELGLFDFDFSCNFIFKLIQHPLVKDQNVKQATDQALKFLVNDDFKNTWASKTEHSLDQFITGIKAHLKGKITKQFTEGLSFLALYTTTLEPFIPSEIALDIHHTDLSLSLSKTMIYKAKYSVFAKHYLGQCIGLASSTMIRKMEFTITQLFQKFQSISRSQPIKPNYFTISPTTWPIDVPHVLAPCEMHIPNGSNDLETYKIPHLSTTDLLTKYEENNDCEYIEFINDFELSSPLDFRFAYSLNPSHLYDSFIKVYSERFGQLQYCFNCKLRRMPEPMESVIFVFQEEFLILICANSGEMSLNLTKTETPITFRSIAAEILLGFYGNYSMFCGHFVLIRKFSKIIFSKTHMHLHRPTALEIKSFDTGSLIIIPEGLSKLPEKFIKDVTISKEIYYGNMKLYNYTTSNAFNHWSSGMLSTFDYLLILNSLTSRSFADISQYPVFPWIISDYESDNATKFTSHRKLNLPMGQQSEDRALQFDQSYNGSFFYGAHYSMGTSVHFFNLRTPPFTFYDWDLHTGWDNMSRIFFDLNYSWQSSSQLNTNDVKELIPEMFSVPEIFMNTSNMNLKEVKLPPWAKTTIHFILVNRDELNECNIGQWIDMIFGSSQTGQAAFSIKNIFLPESYHTYVEENSDEDLLTTMSLRLEHWGQCPIQLFKKNHQERTFNGQKLSLELEKAPNDLQNKQILINTKNCILTYGSFVYKNSLLYNVSSYQVSLDSALIVIDFNACFSNCYTLKFGKQWKLSQIAKLSTMSFKEPVKSLPCSRSMIVASVAKNSIILWDAVRGSFHREIPIDEKIVGITYDEELCLLWVFTQTKIRIFTMNGILVTSTKFDYTLGRILSVHGYNYGQMFVAVAVCENCRLHAFDLDMKTLVINTRDSFKLNSDVLNISPHHEKNMLIVDTVNEKFTLKFTQKSRTKAPQ